MPEQTIWGPFGVTHLSNHLRPDDDGRIEVAIFAGPNARERAIRYADRQYGRFEEVMLEP
jgi:hypothetical protein